MPHWTDALKSVPESVRQRLRNVAREANENMQVVLIRYATERLMYRLSMSKHSDRFVLKGAWLFYVWGISRRATRDVDFLASIPNAAEEVASVFREIVGVTVPHDDGLRFDPDSLQPEEIQLDADYSGIRLRLVTMLGRTRIHTQVDLGFSEAVVEKPIKVTLPVLLDFEPPQIKAYSAEVVVAEKVEAIVKLGPVTTRFKDFFDLYLISHEKHFEGSTLLRQLSATFRHRETIPPEALSMAITDGFARSAESQEQWEAFLRRNDATGVPERFDEVVERLRYFVSPVLQATAQENEHLHQSWTPERGWVRS